MAFDTNTLTAKGVELLASATAAIPIILDGCDATTTYIDQASAIDVSARPTSPLSTTTDVSVIGATANHVMARAHFQAGTNTGGEARTLYLSVMHRMIRRTSMLFTLRVRRTHSISRKRMTL